MNSPTDEATPFERLLTPWRQVATKVDTFVDHVEDAYRKEMRCAAGCAACCQQDLTVLLPEAIALIAAIEGLPPDIRNTLARAGARPSAPPCAFLDDAGRCRIYPLRPIVCRSHGIPIRQDQDVAVCSLNFQGADADTYPPDATLNASIITAALTVADALLRQILDHLEPQPRIPLRLLARHGRGALTPEAQRALALTLDAPPSAPLDDQSPA